jgi:hypothetical protein
MLDLLCSVVVVENTILCFRFGFVKRLDLRCLVLGTQVDTERECSCKLYNGTRRYNEVGIIEHLHVLHTLQAKE